MNSIVRTTIRTPARGTEQAQRRLEDKLLPAMLRTTDRGAQEGRDLLRQDIAQAGLGRLGQAIGAGSDLKRRRVHRTPSGFKVSGDIHIRGRSERTLGALEIYTQGGDIGPRRGGWLWIATKEIPKRANRRRMTPALYNAAGFDQRIGPLVFVPGRHPGEAQLIVKTVTVDRFGRGRARRLPKRGAIGASREKRDQIVAFVGIKRTSRGKRIEPKRVAGQAAANQPRILQTELRNVR